jgi:hypothetical protein
MLFPQMDIEKHSFDTFPLPMHIVHVNHCTPGQLLSTSHQVARITSLTTLIIRINNMGISGIKKGKEDRE